jgi:transposase InsO family protein
MNSRPPHPRIPITLTGEALFRHLVVSQVRASTLAGSDLAAAIKGVTAIEHLDFDGTLREVTPRSLYRWCAAFASGGMPGLEPAQRSRTKTSEVLSESLLAFLREEHALDNKASVPELLRRARARCVIAQDVCVDRVTVYRACVRMGLSLGRRSTKRDTDMRRFAYPHRMMMVLSDGKHFRAGIRRSKRVALFFLDDATRRAIGVSVGTSERTDYFLQGVHEVVRHHGRMDVLYLDKGPGFISTDTHSAIARLPSAFIHGRTRYPQGHGKIEKLNQTAWNGVLRGLAGRAEVDDDCGALTLRLWHYLERVYNCTPHESLDGDTPSERWDRDTRVLRFHDSEAALRDCFVTTETRRVSNDNVVPFESVDYEVPRGHSGTRIEIKRHLLDDTLWVQHDGRFVQLHVVDLAANATSRRGRGHRAQEPAETTPVTAAETLFRNDFGSVVDPDGGFLQSKRDKT